MPRDSDNDLISSIRRIGRLTSDERVWHEQPGALLTHALRTYSIPAANGLPAVFNTRLFDNGNVEDSIHRSKAVGEPPLLLPFRAFFANRDAVSAVSGHRRDPQLSTPATPETILRAVNPVRSAAGLVV